MFLCNDAFLISSNWDIALHEQDKCKFCLKLNGTKSNYIYNLPIDLELNGRPLGSKSIGKWEIQSDFGLLNKIPKRFLCVC